MNPFSLKYSIETFINQLIAGVFYSFFPSLIGRSARFGYHSSHLQRKKVSETKRLLLGNSVSNQEKKYETRLWINFLSKTLWTTLSVVVKSVSNTFFFYFHWIYFERLGWFGHVPCPNFEHLFVKLKYEFLHGNYLCNNCMNGSSVLKLFQLSNEETDNNFSYSMPKSSYNSVYMAYFLNNSEVRACVRS